MISINTLNEAIDGIELIDETSKDKIIFNHKTWLSIIKGIIITYAKKSSSEADAAITRAQYLDAPLKSYMSAVLYSHDEEYHWAMLAIYGNNYWTNGIQSNLPPEYDEWLDSYIKNNMLQKESFEFIEQA